MSISQYNYEAYFLDYHERKLDAQATRELMAFLELHPELKQEFESFENISLNDLEETIKFENKESLKKSITPVNASNFDEMAIQYVEGSLNTKLTAELLAFVKQNPKYESELTAYNLTKLIPDTNIYFEDKKSLKRSIRRPVAYYYWSAAATVALLIGIYFLVNPGNTVSPIKIAANNNKPDTSHIAVQPVPSNNNTVASQNVNQNNIAITPKNIKHTKLHSSTNETPVVYHIKKNDSNTIAVQHKNIVPVHDTNPVIVTNNIALEPTDTSNKNMVQQQPVVQNTNPEKKENKSVFAFAKNTIKGIGKIFKRGGVEFNKYYSKEDSSKVIAYQITLGNNRYTVPLKNSSY
ncbi:MAG TPA: hypothetical protein VNY36_06325 [Bacteroidia bacterium]|jgi:hypothetical protein|nr:hypothetical protein [Bacteroidia bacterium]